MANDYMGLLVAARTDYKANVVPDGLIGTSDAQLELSRDDVSATVTPVGMATALAAVTAQEAVVATAQGDVDTAVDAVTAGHVAVVDATAAVLPLEAELALVAEAEVTGVTQVATAPYTFDLQDTKNTAIATAQGDVDTAVAAIATAKAAIPALNEAAAAAAQALIAENTTLEPLVAEYRVAASNDVTLAAIESIGD